MTYANISVTLSRSLSLLYEDMPGDDLAVSANTSVILHLIIKKRQGKHKKAKSSYKKCKQARVHTFCEQCIVMHTRHSNNAYRPTHH